VTESFGQGGFSHRFEWGPAGVAELATAGSIVVIVDVLRFTTAVEACNSRGVAVFPYRWKDFTAQEFANSLDAELIDSSTNSSSALSPVALLRQPKRASIVLPSPNGSLCAVVAGEMGATVVAACLRNAAAVAEFVARSSATVSVIACGERWPDGSLRPALEDLLGAGAVLSYLGGHLSPEASAAVAAWEGAKQSIRSNIVNCASGQELLARGRLDDLEYAAEIGVSTVVPTLMDGAFRRAS
jgi:2-phosphosulfolactate phosphatase